MHFLYISLNIQIMNTTKDKLSSVVLNISYHTLTRFQHRKYSLVTLNIEQMTD